MCRKFSLFRKLGELSRVLGLKCLLFERDLADFRAKKKGHLERHIRYVRFILRPPTGGDYHA